VAEAPGERPGRVIRHNRNSPWNNRIEGQTAVYRLYGSDRRLLYVGISTNPDRRWYEHSLEKMWWHLVTEKQVSWHENREQALIVEEEVERRENPRFGDTHRLGSGWRRSGRKEDPALQAQMSELVQRLAKDISAGQHPGGCKMPSARKLAEAHGVSILMAGMALETLARSGILLRQGVRGFAVPPREEGVR
jgi:predicted GIY-YIG superfamily endonuclease